MQESARQIGIATIRFCDAHKADFPEWWHVETAGERTWIYTRAAYLENVDAIRICPNDPLADERLKAKATSYVINDYLAANVQDAPRNLRQVATTHGTMLAFEGADATPVGPKFEHVHAADWFSEFNVNNDFVLWAIRQALQIDCHHHTGANHVFLTRTLKQSQQP